MFFFVTNVYFIKMAPNLNCGLKNVIKIKYKRCLLQDNIFILLRSDVENTVGKNQVKTRNPYFLTFVIYL